MNPVTVLWVEDTPAFRRGPMKVLSNHKSLRVRACKCSDLEGAVPIRCEVIMIDTLSWEPGLQRLKDTVGRVCVFTPVILFGRADRLHEYAELVLEGKAGYLTNTATDQEICRSVKAAVRREIWFQKGLRSRLIAELYGARERRGGLNLNDREQQVVEGLVQGKLNKEMAEQLGCSVWAVKACVARLCHKTGASNRSGLASYAVTKGLARLD